MVNRILEHLYIGPGRRYQTLFGLNTNYTLKTQTQTQNVFIVNTIQAPQ